jgi:hypothetical protein
MPMISLLTVYFAGVNAGRARGFLSVLTFVMPGLDPGIQQPLALDPRVKPEDHEVTNP